MNNFFEKALAVNRRYYQAAIESKMYVYGTDYNVETFNPCNDEKIEILSQLVATYFMYDGNIPNKFSISLSKLHNLVYLADLLCTIFSDLATTYKVNTVSHKSPSLLMYPRYVTSYTYDITLLE